jgi:GNAT superfamily N-acetyltransferase
LPARQPGANGAPRRERDGVVTIGGGAYHAGVLAGFSTDEVLHELLVAPRAALVPLPDTRIIERPGWWQIVTPSLTRGGMNEVSSDEIPEDTADAIIDETIADYRRLGIRFRWNVRPGVKPADLAERLARRGLVRSESFAMARATSGVPESDGAGITVDEIDLANVDDFTRVLSEGWEMDPAPVDALHRRMLADPARRNQLFIARHEGTAAATAAYVALDRSAYLIGAVALPAFRGRGLYRALVHARLRHAAARGIRLATSNARATTSAPVLARLGFESVCPLQAFSND